MVMVVTEAVEVENYPLMSTSQLKDLIYSLIFSRNQVRRARHISMICLASQITLEVLVVVTTLHMRKTGETMSGTLSMIVAARRLPLQELSQTLHIIFSIADVVQSI